MLRPAADDQHFAVREWAWMTARPTLTAHLIESITVLSVWTGTDSERIRRFTSEALCPRGVWAKHIAALKHDPELGLQILEPLRSDTSRYVQDSVANWINDASKTQPEWVGQFADRWLQESPTPETTRIVSRGLRSIRD
ncbi:DNA alkylation repair protein [Glutamicibacter ardleyensis]|uniref:DNA alkylation repair protein n=1 Tax=Glutamicibacter ardleyensis TaxID=225894 RepID=UPI003FD65038